MKKAFYIRLVSYMPLLKAAGMRYHEEEKMLTVGQPDGQAGFALFVSCRTLDTPKVLECVLPLLRETAARFRLVKDQQTQYRLNSGDFGESEVGKVLSIFPDTLGAAALIADQLCKLTHAFRGPIITQARRIGEVIYVQAVSRQGDQLHLSLPKLAGFPFPVPVEYRAKKNRNRLIGTYYLPVQTLRSAPKGNIYKAINLKGFAFDWCLIKQGNPVALDDHFDRDMGDRLLWQKKVIQCVQETVMTPGFIDHFERDGSSYLVTGFAEGHSLGRSVRDLLSGKEWHRLSTDQKGRLLGWYLKALAIVARLHEAGFVHRDITDSNFIVLKDDSLCVIDFELAYSLERQEPDPPFLLGTFGYAAPEQLEYAFPDIREDVYSLGALLAFTLTGCPPREFLNASGPVIKAKLKRLTQSDRLALTVTRCLALQRRDRPSITFIRGQIQSYLSTLNIDHHEEQNLAS